jgi:hypothetical protein
MLDYTSNAVTCWPTAWIRSRFEQSCGTSGSDSVVLLRDFLQPDQSLDDAASLPDRFWQTVDTNLRAGRIRLVFVADVIPPELRRIVEFLGSQMKPAEVLAIEVKQYVGPGFKTLVPTVIGGRVGPLVHGNWDRGTFFAELRANKGNDIAVIAEKILAWAEGKLPYIWWGTGAQTGSFYAGLKTQSHTYEIFSVWTYGRIYIEFQRLMRLPAFKDEKQRLELARRLNQIPGVDIALDRIAKMPALDLVTLSDPARLDQFFDALTWCISEIETAERLREAVRRRNRLPMVQSSRIEAADR